MNKLEKIFLLLFYIFLSVSPLLGLYEEQVGKFDWIQRYVGQVEHIVFDQSNSPSRRVIVSTGQNVLAALSVKSGDILWRHILEPTEIGKIEIISSNEHFVSAVTGNLIRTWDVITAALQQEVVLDSLPNWSGTFDHIFEFGSNPEDLFLIVLSTGKITAYVFDSSSGAVVSQRSIVADWVQRNAKCSIGGSVLVCIDAIGGKLHYLLLTSNENVLSSVPLSSFGINEVTMQQAAADPGLTSISKVSGSGSHFLVKIGATKKLIHGDKEGVHVVKDVSQSGTQIVAIEKDVFFAVTQHLRSMTVQAFDLSTGVEIAEQGVVVELPLHSGAIQAISIHRFLRKDGVLALRALISCSDHSIHLISSAGILWSREEALAVILKVEAIDLPVEGAEATYNDQMSYNPGLLSSFLHRLRGQAGQAVGWFNSILGRADNLVNAHQPITRDSFNMRKLLVVVTNSGKILALDNYNGEIIWSMFIPTMSPFKDNQFLLFSQRSSAHYPSGPQCVIVGKHKQTGEGLLYVFNPLNGEGLGAEGGVVSLGFVLLQASILQQITDDYIKPLLLIDTNLEPHVFPSSAEYLVQKWKNSLYVHISLPGSSTLKGYSFRDSKPDSLKLSEVWSLSLGSSVEITGMYSKRYNDKVHSAGRVLADRSVLYKYTNPNLVVVTTFGQDVLSKNTLTVHLVDMVTGSVLESVSHKRVSGPFHVVHSENWVVYTSYNEKFRRHEVTTLELFEGLEQSNATAFTSFGAKATPPIVERQAFILPCGVQASSHTTTQKGITTKFILFALQTGNVLQMSKWYLDPRRPMAHGGPREEGLVPYMPELPMPHQEMINHNKTLPRVSAIHTSPTGLESACLVLVYGLDLFYTRVFPSKMFDVLQDDFDHYLIIGALLSLTTAVFVTRKLSQRKALKQAWK